MAIRFLTGINIQAGTLTVSTIANLTTASNLFLVSDSGLVKYRTAAQVRSDIGAGTGTVTSITISPGTGISGGGTITSSGTLTITNSDLGSSQAIFKNIAVSGQPTVTANINNDTLNFAAGANVTLTTNAGTDTITIASSYVDTNNYPTSLAWATGTGILTLGRNGLSALTVDLDGRYLELSGGTMTGNLGINGVGTSSIINGTGDGADFTTYNFAISGHYGMAFYNPTAGGTYPNQASGVVNFREGTINMKGGFLANGLTVLSTGNYNSYAPSLTGAGASGSWGISVTGNAATATALTSMNISQFTNDSGYITSAAVNANYASKFTTLTINGVGYDLSANRSWTISAGTGTVTSVAALTLGTSGTDLSSTVATGTTTPVITLNVPNASATARGVITTGAQTIAGDKTFSNTLTASSFSYTTGNIFPYVGSTIYSNATGGTHFFGGGPGSVQNNLAVQNGTFYVGNTPVLGAPNYGLTPDAIISKAAGGVIDIRNLDTTISAGAIAGTLQFSVRSDSASAYVNASIRTLLTTGAGTGNAGISDLVFYTNNGGAGSSPTEKMRLNTAGLLLTNETASTIASFDSNKNIKSLATSTYPSLAELAYVKGVTSAIQTQLNSKGSGTVTGVTGTAPIVSSGGTAPAISITAATTGAAGSMSAADKTKLDGIQAGAQVNVSTNLSKSSSTTDVSLNSSTGSGVNIGTVTTLVAGVMTAADKIKLDGIAPGSQVGTVTSVTGTGSYNGLSLSGTVTGSGNITFGGTPSGTWPISVTGNSATADSATISLYVSSPDGDRVAGNKLPNGNPPRAVQYDFASAGSVTGATGNFAGVMTYRPWDGTSASTGDSSYQLAFANQSGVNASGPAQLLLRNGINTTWNSWQTMLSSSNYNSYSPTLTGGGASGTWGINITGNAGSASSAATLTTARTINGTSFNGSANITTASWGTARTITIGSTGKSVDGSANVSWSLAEIGAYAATNPSGYITSSDSISGNAATATALSSGQGNWSGTGVLGNVVGMLAWKNYGNGHVIFDASNSLTPSGTACSNSTPQNNWTGTFPTLMGWNGSNTYGVRVDSTRVADGLTSMNISQFTNNSGYTTNVGTVTSIVAGTGLSGGTITSSGTIALANTAVTAGSYTAANITVDAQGRITAASNGSGGGGISGSGTTSYIPKWSGTTSLTNSAIFDNGTNVLIGTADVGTPAFGSAPQFAVANAGGGVIDIRSTNTNIVAGTVFGRLQFTGKDDAAVGYTTAAIEAVAYTTAGTGSGGGSKLKFMTAASNTGSSPQPRMWVNSFGYVSVGSTDLGYSNFSVSGSVYATDAVYSGAGNGCAIGNPGFLGDDVGLWGLNNDEIIAMHVGSTNTFYYANQAIKSTNGFVGIQAAANYPLHVGLQNGNISIYADYDIVAYSDESVKENIRPIENVIERVQKSRGVLYDRIDSGHKDNIGFIAQELEVTFPELVVTNEDGTKAVKYQNAVAVMFEAIKEQQKQIDELKELVNKLIK